jgi:hypothetical protein
MEVRLGKPTLEDVGETMFSAARVGPGDGEMSSGEEHEEWVDITVAVELQPWPDRHWLAFWQEMDLEWPEHLEAPTLDGRRLIFEAREQELEEAWAAVKARVEATNRLYREEFDSIPQGDEPEMRGAEPEPLARLREAAKRRVDALE